MFDLQRPSRNLKRLRQIQAVFVHYGFDFLFDREEVQTIRRAFSSRFRQESTRMLQLSMAERLRLMIQELGPTYVKLGQILSSRSDLLPRNFTDELVKLQDQVPPFPFAQVREVIEKDFGMPLEKIFVTFEKEPFAAASIGQVHNALLYNGTEVVVKVQRPNIKQQIQADMEIIGTLVKMVEASTGYMKKFGLSGVFDEFSRTLRQELDYRNEAANADRLRRLMRDYPQTHIPYMFWDFTSERVLTMERIRGYKVNNLQALDVAGVDRKELADVFIKSLLSQLLLDGFFHADPHPGNLMVQEETHALVYLDLGMMGRLLPSQREQLEDIILSILRRDAQDVARIVLTIGTPFGKVDEPNLVRSIDQIISRYLDLSLEQLDFGMLLREVLTVVFHHNIRLPSELSLALKTMMQGEEVARTLDPQIAVVEIAQRIGQKILMARMRPENWIDMGRDTLREMFRLQNVLPRAVESILRQLEAGKLTVAVDIPMFKWIVNTVMIIANRLVAGLIVTGMLVASALIMNNTSTQLGYYLRLLGMAGFAVALLLGASLVWSVIVEIAQMQKNKKDDF